MDLLIKFGLSLFVLILTNCSTGMRLTSSGGSSTTQNQVLTQGASSASSGGGVATTGNLTMSLSIGSTISGMRQVSSSGRFQRN